MKFQKALREAIIEKKRRLDEMLLTNLIDDWPFFVVKQYRILTAQDPQVKAKLQKELDAALANIEITPGQLWTGDLKNDLLVAVNKKQYNNVSSYTIKDGQIYIVDGMNKEWINYLTSPAAQTLLKRVGELLTKQSGSAATTNANQQVRQNQAATQASAVQQNIPQPASSALNKLSTI